MREAIIVVDVQNDFCEGGSLAVEGGNEVAENLAKFLPTVPSDTLIVFTQDWHKKNDTNGGHIALPPEAPDFIDSWPVHCIAGTKGAALHPALKQYASPAWRDFTFRKGYGKPSYSGFEGGNPEFALDSYLKQNGITHVSVAGLALDYCVRATALDGISNGYDVRVLADLTRGIASDTRQVIEEIYDADPRNIPRGRRFTAASVLQSGLSTYVI